ncbi:hypothetical protein [Paraliobacillus sp. X-1268]|uniref:hypothetical protein n=1 Tax=Paraliobacillus sp. X-1268 TaxID=2213193 RepID=UPI000E3B86D3|nr:hypothetical protein [Paraliobacillus sp. X-1268]
MADAQEILFGTGDLFVVPEEVDLEVDTQEVIDAALVKVGESSGEATLAVEYEFADVRGGTANQIMKSVMTSETISFSAGIVTYDLDKIGEFVAGEYSEDETERKLKLGGGFKVPVKRLRFVHTKDDGKKIMMDMHKAQNRAGLEWIFNVEEQTNFEYEFTLMKDPNVDNIVTITEEI